jgi:hypothetical protein
MQIFPGGLVNIDAFLGIRMELNEKLEALHDQSPRLFRERPPHGNALVTAGEDVC